MASSSSVSASNAHTVLNVNIGILGHVDSGKTSLVKALSTLLSTAALDKHPQSQQRGITLDLGFSSFTIPLPSHLQAEVESERYTALQVTLVDCPGHASLIRTIIGGAQIIDMMLLVVDVNKGIQTQTAECIVIGEITTDKMVIVLNKIDLLPEEEREEKIAKAKKRLTRALASSKFSSSPMIPLSAVVGGEKVAAVGGGAGKSSGSVKTSAETIGISQLIDTICSYLTTPVRVKNAPFYFAIDHCFAIKGHGTVLTGTILSGTVAVNSQIELPQLQLEKKVKSLQMFRQPVQTAKQGDRVGICVTNLDPKAIERGIAASPRSVPLLYNVVCLVKKIRFFKQPCKSLCKVHVSIGHTTVVATTLFFGKKELQEAILSPENMSSVSSAAPITNLGASYHRAFPSIDFKFQDEFEYQEELVGSDGMVYGEEPVQWALLRFQQPVFCPIGSLIIASRLDMEDGHRKQGQPEESSTQCRLAFYGPVKASLVEADIKNVKVYHSKEKHCEIFKLTDVRDRRCYELIAWKLFGQHNNMVAYVGLVLETDAGEIGVISGSFGTAGKFKVKFANGADASNLKVGSKPSTLLLRHRRYIHEGGSKKIKQFVEAPDSSEGLFIPPTAPQSSESEVDPEETVVNTKETKIVATEPKSKAVKLPTAAEEAALAEKKRANAVAWREKNKAAADVKQKEKLNDTTRSNEGKIVEGETKGAVVNEKKKPEVYVPVPIVLPSFLGGGGVRGSTKAKSSKESAEKNNSSSEKNPVIVKAIEDKIDVVETSSTSSCSKIAQSTVNEATISMIFRNKYSSVRKGTVEKLSTNVEDENNTIVAIIVGAFKMEENIRSYVATATVFLVDYKTSGRLLGPFAKAGKCKVEFNKADIPSMELLRVSSDVFICLSPSEV